MTSLARFLGQVSLPTSHSWQQGEGERGREAGGRREGGGRQAGGRREAGGREGSHLQGPESM